METFNTDPKPGRLVLPLVLIGMIATTYTFVNRVATDNNLDVGPVEEQVQEDVEQNVDESKSKSTLGFPKTSNVSLCVSEPHSVVTVKLRVYEPFSVKVIIGF